MNGFDLDGASIPRGAIKGGGPSRDGIPSIDSPNFVDAAAARTMYSKTARAMVVRVGKEVRAYPIPVLDWHEIVNDQIGDRPLVVTYCPLCGSGVVFESTVDKKRLTFGVSGLLYQSDMLLYDRETESLWSQLLMKAVTGKYRGTGLAVYPSTNEPLIDVLKRHPKAKVLSTDTGYSRDHSRYPYGDYRQSRRLVFRVDHPDHRAHPKAWSLLLRGKDDALIIPVEFLDPTKNMVKVTVAGTKIVVVYDTEKRRIACENNPVGIDCVTGFYFALHTFYPDARVREKAIVDGAVKAKEKQP
jgi:hypothetical protein